jgi:hypothetical protein
MSISERKAGADPAHGRVHGRRSAAKLDAIVAQSYGAGEALRDAIVCRQSNCSRGDDWPGRPL